MGVFFSLFPFGLACNSIEPTAGTLQREPEYIDGNSRAVKCFINYIWCYIPYQRWKQWLYSELLYKSTALQSLHCWSILWYTHATLRHVHSGMSLSTLRNQVAMIRSDIKKQRAIYFSLLMLTFMTEFVCTWSKEDWRHNITSYGLSASSHHSLWLW